MSADFSRVRFDPLRDHSGIGIQQGRLWLDADFNEQVAITDRRLRAQAVDLQPSPAAVSRLTPKAFEITLFGGKLSIGAGRMYVDGLLAENHGGAIDFDPVLAEPNGAGTIEYLQQPYWPSPAPLPTAGTHLVYLQVWERELDHLTTPDLVESAIGVDTTIRAQTAWQVRVLPDVGDSVTCGSTIAKWDELIAPSSARLTTGTVETDPITDPCEIPPGKGYRGPENQLYRVELHSPTQFKWSRDNASIASAVVEVVSPTSLRLHSLGRDDVLRIKDNDWVEITDDRRELSHAPGEMRQVTVNPATATITFSPALPADLVPSTHHLRVRKWDSPLITIPAAGSAVALEHGVTVKFTFATTGKPRPGDAWVFAARATAPDPEESLEKLVAAPPRTTHYHYARLALVTLPGTVQDCRPDWPSGTGDGCGCEVCVTPESHAGGDLTIQAAIDLLGKSGGGTITLCPGEYRLDAPLTFDRLRSMRLRGAGRASKLTSDGPSIVVSQCQHIALEDFSIVGNGDGPAILLDQVNQFARLEGLWLQQRKSIAVALGGIQLATTIRGCLIDARIGIAAGASAPEGKAAGLMTLGLSIEDNLLTCDIRGIDLGIDKGAVIQHSGLTRISGNTVIECADSGITVTGLIAQGVADLDGSLDICGNVLEVDGAAIVTGGRARINDNTLTGNDRAAQRHGIALTASPPDTPDGIAHVLGNKVTGFGGTAIAVTAAMRSLIVKQNIIRGTASGIVMQAKGFSRSVSIDNNQILDLRPIAGAEFTPRSAAAATVASSDEPTFVLHPTFAASSEKAAAATTITSLAGVPTAATGATPATMAAAAASRATAAAPVAAVGGRAGYVLGIMVTGIEAVTIIGNTVDGLAADENDAGQSRITAGIVMTASGDGRVSGNTVSRIGHPQSVGSAYGIVVSNWEGTASIVDNTVLAGASSGPLSRPGWIALSLFTGINPGLGVTRMATVAAGTWTFAGSHAYLQRQVLGHAELTGNALYGGGESVAALLMTPGDVVMSSNRCAQPVQGDQSAIRLTAGVAVVQGNRLHGGHPSMTMDVDVDAASVIGNITSGGIQIRGTMVENTGKPWSPLNTIA